MIISMSPEIRRKAKTMKGGDRDFLVIDGDRYLIVDPSSKVGTRDASSNAAAASLRFRNLMA